MSMTQDQKRHRANARKAAISVTSGITYAVDQQKEADSWKEMAEKLEKKHGPEDETALWAKKRAEEALAIADQQTERAVRAAKEAAHQAHRSIEVSESLK